MTQQVEVTYLKVDERCAHYAQRIIDTRGNLDAKKLQTTVRNALGVMREQGLYAFKLFLDYRKGDGGAVIWEQTKCLWQNGEIGLWPSGNANDGAKVRQLTTDLNDLLLAREVTERMLIYALYGLRAL